MGRKRPTRSASGAAGRKNGLLFKTIGGCDTFTDQSLPRPRSYAEPDLQGLGDRIVPGFLEETYGGGELEPVPGFRPKRAITEGLDGIYAGSEPEKGSRRGVDQCGSISVRRRLETVYYDPEDDRVQIVDTARIPWRAICHLYIARETGVTTTGTGWLAGPDLVVTAGHNYLHHQEGGVATSIIVTAGHDGTVRPPYPPVATVSAYIHPAWESDADPSFDFAFLRLSDDRLGRRTGYLAFADAPDDFLRGVLINIAGYPYDKPYATLWYSAGRLYRRTATRVAYHIDTKGGYSGAPLVYKQGRKRIVLAMHTQGDPTLEKSRYNTGVRVTGAFFDSLKRATGFS